MKKSALTEKRLIPLEKQDEKQKLSDQSRFVKDYNSIYKKIVGLFPNIDSKTTPETAVFINKYLVYQLIWTLKYLVESAIVENNKEWLKHNLPRLKERIKQIKINITAADPNLKSKLQEGVDKLLTKTETLLKEERQNIALRWAENIISLGGSAIRDMSEGSRLAVAAQRLKEKSEYISDHNAAALLSAESYQQYLQEKAFNKEIVPLIITHNRLKQLHYIEERLKKDPTNQPLLSEQAELLSEQKRQDETESKTREIMGDKDYNEMIEKRKIKLEKFQIQSKLSMLAQEYLQISKSLFLESSEPSNQILLGIDLLQKSLSKTLTNDEISLPCQELEKFIKHIRDEIQKLKNLSEKSPFGKRSEFKLPTGAVPTALAFSLMPKKITEADYKKISKVKAIRDEFFHLSVLHSSKDQFIAENKPGYEKYIVKAAEYFLSCPKEQYDALLFEIDIKEEFTAEKVHLKFLELSLIFHPDKLSSKEAKLKGQLIFPFIVQTKRELINRLNRLFDIQVGGPMTDILRKTMLCINRTRELLESAGKLPSLSKNNNSLYNQLRTSERRSSMPSLPLKK